MPPKLTPERIEEKLVELRAYVANHADVLRLRPGASVLEKLRQTASKEEKAWHNFLTKTAKSFTTAHEEHLAATYALINEPHTKVIGDIHERHGTYCYRIKGKYSAEGPRRLTWAEATKDRADIWQSASMSNTEEEKRNIAQSVLRSLSKGLSYADSEKARAARRRFTQEAKELALSQASEEHAVPLAASLEMNRIQHLVRECAEIPQLHGLRWGRVADIMPQPYRNNAQGQFPGLRNLGNTCFLNAVCQCFVHVSSLRQRLRAPGAILPLLPGRI